MLWLEVAIRVLEVVSTWLHTRKGSFVFQKKYIFFALAKVATSNLAGKMI